MTGHGPSSRRSGPVQLYQGRQVGAGCRQRHAEAALWPLVTPCLIPADRMLLRRSEQAGVRPGTSIRQRRRRPHLAPYAAAGCASAAPGEGGRAPAGGGPQVLENLFGPGGVQPPFCHTFDQRGLRATRASPSRTWRSACFRASSIRLICPLMRWRAECSRQGQPRHLMPRCRPVCVELRRLSALPYGRRPPARRPSHASLLRRLRT